MRSGNVFPGIVLLMVSLLLSSCSIIQGITRIGFGFILFVAIQMILIVSALVMRPEEK